MYIRLIYVIALLRDLSSHSDTLSNPVWDLRDVERHHEYLVTSIDVKSYPCSSLTKKLNEPNKLVAGYKNVPRSPISLSNAPVLIAQLICLREKVATIALRV